MKRELVVAIIPARGGSKTISKKNLKRLGGKPLVAWPIETALSVKGIDRVYVTTDDARVGAVSMKYGADVVVRPRKLAEDETPTLPVLKHAIEKIEGDGDRVGIVVLLYPTSPFLRRVRIVKALKLFDSTKCNSILGVRTHWKTLWKRKNGGLAKVFPQKRVNRQQVKPLYVEAGEIFFSRREVIMDMNRVIDPDKVKLLEIEGEGELMEIDEWEDLVKARKWLANGRLHAK